MADGTISASSAQGEFCSLSVLIDPVEAGEGTYVVPAGDHEAGVFGEEDLFAGGEHRITRGG